MHRLSQYGLLLLLLLILHTYITTATPPVLLLNSGSAVKAPPKLSPEVQRLVHICKALKRPARQHSNVNKRVVSVVPRWPGSESVTYSTGCTHANILWSDNQNAQQLSTLGGTGQLEHEIISRESLGLYWTRTNAPPEMIDLFAREQLFPLCTTLAQAVPNSQVGPHDFELFPRGFSVIVGYANDRQHPHVAMHRMVTGARFLFMFNIKHGFIVIHATEEPMTWIRKHYNHWNKEYAESQAPVPSTLSGVLASEWQSQHHLAGMIEYYNELRLSDEFVLSSIDKLNMIILPSLRDRELIGIVMACLSGRIGQPAGGNLPTFENAHRVGAGSYCYNMLFGTDTLKGVAEFLYEHRDDIGRKVISSIMVFSREAPHQEQYPTLLLAVETYTEALGEAWTQEQMRGLP